MNRWAIFLGVLVILGGCLSAQAEEGDTTTVVTFNREFHNWASPHDSVFVFPPDSVHFTKITLTYLLGCPTAPGDCDPWDRLGALSVMIPTSDSTSESLELARIVTPYDITGGGGPGTCGWEFDLTDYGFLLRDSVTLRSYIETWINDSRGWLVTATFRFIEGMPEQEAYRIVRLWRKSYLVYGDPAQPTDVALGDTTVEVDAATDSLKLRVITTGHGQGNTDNAAEFSNKQHSVWVTDQQFIHQLWRSDCASNPCSPQGGTWPYNRAGWCPGASVIPWDLTPYFTPGEPLTIWYAIQDYVNFCRPTNLDCSSGVTCADCNYNYTGHTEPNYNTEGQLIFYRVPLTNAAERPHPALPDAMTLGQNFPNPFNPETTIPFVVATSGYTRLTVTDVTGRVVATLVDGLVTRGGHAVSFDGSRLSSGVYFCSLAERGTDGDAEDAAAQVNVTFNPNAGTR